MEGPWAIWQREQWYQPPGDVSPVAFLRWLVLKRPCNAVGWQNHLGFFVQYWLLCLETDEPNTSAWDQSPVWSAGFWTERWGCKCNFGGSLLQCKVSLCLQKFRSWLLSKHPQIPWSCCELYMVCKPGKHTVCPPAQRDWIISLYKSWKCKDEKF